MKAAAGFVSGHWSLDRAAGESIAFIVLESEAAARALVESGRGNAAAQEAVGLRLRSIRVMEVQASA